MMKEKNLMEKVFQVATAIWKCLDTTGIKEISMEIMKESMSMTTRKMKTMEGTQQEMELCTQADW